jgi:hypothetical protein
MTEGPEQFSIDRRGTCTQIVVRGELDMGCAPAFRRTLDRALAGSPDTVPVDLESVAFLDSTAVAVLLLARLPATLAVPDGVRDGRGRRVLGQFLASPRSPRPSNPRGDGPWRA